MQRERAAGDDPAAFFMDAVIALLGTLRLVKVGNTVSLERFLGIAV